MTDELPTGSVEMVNIAWPFASSVPVPSTVQPCLNVTVPAGVPEPGAKAVTVAVKVTLCPNTDGFTDDVTAVLVLAGFTVWLRALDVLLLKFVSLP